MDRLKIDFLKELSKDTGVVFERYVEKKKKVVTFGRITGLLGAAVLIVVLSYATRAVISGQTLAAQFGNTSVFNQLKHLVGADEKTLSGESDDRINIVLLGIGGANHEGGQLTDTIMVASIQPSTKTMGLLSIPRDLVVPIEGVGWNKINYAHAVGKMRNSEIKDAGPKLAEKTIEDITGLTIDYYVKADFAGFTKIIDALGGVRVYVPTAFTDYQYPDSNHGYEPVSFPVGWQDLDGSMALKYARSRHGTAGEGSDFARARRQQDILQALQGRVTALSTLLNPNKIINLADIVGANVSTDMEIWESLKLFELAKQINTQNINHVVLSNSVNGLLVSDIGEDGAYLLRPRLGSDNFSEIRMAAASLLEKDPYSFLSKPTTPGAPKTKLAIQNGTAYPGLASRTAALLQTLPYQIVAVGNAARRDYEKTVIYNITAQVDEMAIQKLREELKANVASAVPDFVRLVPADLLIIVGKDNIPVQSLSLSIPLLGALGL